MFQRRKSIKARKKEMGRVLQDVQKVDLIFLVDCTLSMQKYICAVKTKINAILHEAKQVNKSLNLRLGFVGYRDHSDGINRIAYFPFSENIKSFKKFLGNVEAFGGGDAPEDVFGGLEVALKQDWKSSTRAVIHIGKLKAQDDLVLEKIALLGRQTIFLPPA